MKHRINDHPERVKDCKHGDKCSFSLCWYKHKEIVSSVPNVATNESTTEATEPESIESNNAREDFQNAQTKEKPPLNQKH